MKAYPNPGDKMSIQIRRFGPWAARWVTACLCAATLAMVLGRGEAAPTRSEPRTRWKQVHPHWQRAYVLSFRSPDLLTNDRDEQWGQSDGRLYSGGIRSDFPGWLRDYLPAIREARAAGRPILLSLHTHSGYGVGLVTYSRDLKRGEAVTYPWLMRQLAKVGLNTPDVTVAIDTCNAEATAVYQIRPDLQPTYVAAWNEFARWRKSHPARRALPVPRAYQLFSQDHVAKHLSRSVRGRRENVEAEPWEPLTAQERRSFQAHLYGPRGVIYATPALFNLLRLGPNPRGTMTANLLKGTLSGRHYDSFLSRNKAEFRRFTEFAFLEAAGDWPQARSGTQTVREGRKTEPPTARIDP